MNTLQQSMMMLDTFNPEGDLPNFVKKVNGSGLRIVSVSTTETYLHKFRFLVLVEPAKDPKQELLLFNSDKKLEEFNKRIATINQDGNRICSLSVGRYRDWAYSLYLVERTQ